MTHLQHESSMATLKDMLAVLSINKVYVSKGKKQYRNYVYA